MLSSRFQSVSLLPVLPANDASADEFVAETARQIDTLPLLEAAKAARKAICSLSEYVGDPVMRRIALIGSVAILSAYQTIVTILPADCAAFIPDSWKLAVPGAQLPEDDTVQEWQKFGVAQSGQLSKANGRSADIIHIVTICETKATGLDRAARC